MRDIMPITKPILENTNASIDTTAYRGVAFPLALKQNRMTRTKNKISIQPNVAETIPFGDCDLFVNI